MVSKSLSFNSFLPHNGISFPFGLQSLNVVCLRGDYITKMVRLVSQSVTGSHSVLPSSSFCVQFFSNYFFSLKKHARLLLRPQKISSSWISCAVEPGRLPPPPLSVVVMPAEVVLAIVHPLAPFSPQQNKWPGPYLQTDSQNFTRTPIYSSSNPIFKFVF